MRFSQGGDAAACLPTRPIKLADDKGIALAQAIDAGSQVRPCGDESS